MANETMTLEEMKLILGGIAQKIVTPVHITKDTAKFYYPHFKDYPADLVKTAGDYYLEGKDGTFFPSISALLTAVRDILALSMGIPSPLEAWGMILNSNQYTAPAWCIEGASLRDAINHQSNGDYWRALWKYSDHMQSCTICHYGIDGKDFGHPAVASTVRMLGGLSAIITGNPVSDRARWIEAYQEVIEREVRRATTSSSIKGYIAALSQMPNQIMQKRVLQLADRLGMPAQKASRGLSERSIQPSRTMNGDIDNDEIIAKEKKAAFDRGE